MVNKPRNNGTWSEARFNSFIKSLLRKGTMRWAPKNLVLKEARTVKGVYLCAGCKEEVPVTVKKDGKRVRNVFVDHINPIVSVETGFTSWDEYINRMFCEVDNLQVLCSDCHTIKTAKERQQAKEAKDGRRRNTTTKGTRNN
jgi:5-methylcytosine-specific restriction endonuclease McrA